MRGDYPIWLEERGIIGKHKSSQLSHVKNVEKAYGDLEEHFNNGTYQDIIYSLEYSTTDEIENKPNPSKIKTSGVIRTNLQSYKKAANKYLTFLQKTHIKTYNDYQKLLTENIEKSIADGHEARIKRLKHVHKKPNKRTVTITVYDRNPDVVAEVLTRANGTCEECNSLAPFKRKHDNTPYLEVHHKTMLADGGDDTIENAQALCPNCHREKHYG